MRYFLDTEFIEDGKTIELISIGIVAEDGREYYACNDEAHLSRASDWVKRNVLIHLPRKHVGVNPGNPFIPPSVREEILRWKTRDQIKRDILEFCKTDKDHSIEFWADYASYDWVALCQIFGTMMDLPSHFPMYCNDIQQWRRELGNPELPVQEGIVHHALYDARYCKQLFTFLFRTALNRSAF